MDVQDLLVDTEEVAQVDEPFVRREDEDAPATGAPRTGHHPVLAEVEPVTVQALEVSL